MTVINKFTGEVQGGNFSHEAGSQGTLAAAGTPANDTHRPMFEGNLAIAQQPQNVINRVLARKRKKSRHPLRELRLQRGFTLEELASMTELSPSYLSRLESGTRRLNADILQRLADILACHPGDLLPTESNIAKFSSGNFSQNQAGESFGPARYQAQDLPFYRLQASPGQPFKTMEATPSEWVMRPHELQGVAGAVSFTLSESVHNARFRAGDRVYAHPSRPLSPGCSILAVTTDNNAMVGEFVRWNPASDANGSVLVIRTPETGETENLISQDKLKGVFRIVGFMEAA
ncbi:MAG: helix-turn-helix domain-containing protein [Holosporales bacterium]